MDVLAEQGNYGPRPATEAQIEAYHRRNGGSVPVPTHMRVGKRSSWKGDMRSDGVGKKDGNDGQEEVVRDRLEVRRTGV